MPGRTSPFQTSVSGMSDGSDSYRYGFNGKENDFEPKNGQGTQQDYGMRIYDPRLGKFLSVDPLQKDFPWWSPYHFAGNSPLENIDLDGLETYNYNLIISANTGKSALVITSIEHGSLCDALTVQKVNYKGGEYIIDAEWNYAPYHGFNNAFALGGKTEAELDEYFANKQTTSQQEEERRQKSQKAYEQAGQIVFLSNAINKGNEKKQSNSPEKKAQKNQVAANNSVKSDGKKLNWTAVVPKKGKYKGQSREEHVRLHNTDNTAKPDHGIFNGDGVAITNDAWSKAQSIGLKPDAQGVLVVPYKNAGKSGGANGDGSELNNVTIHVVPGTENIITSYPSK